MNNLSSYCGLVDAKTRASDKDLPVRQEEELKNNQVLLVILMQVLCYEWNEGHPLVPRWPGLPRGSIAPIRPYGDPTYAAH